MEPGDTIFIREGTYVITEDQIMGSSNSGLYACVFDFSEKSGTSSKRICVWGFRDERPVFDLSQVKPANQRVAVFYVSKHYHHFKNFEVVSTQVTITDHTQSECFRNDGGNNNIYENLSMHDGMAIGFYLTRGMNNLVLNCDAYNNYDPVSENGSGGNVDGFGAHVPNSGHTGNVFRGCRAWWNSDDGFDLINAFAPVTIENCWAFYNGYKPNSTTSAGDGSGFKSGGYGMESAVDIDFNNVPRHTVRGCLAYYNKNQGFYANHHLGGINFYNNTGYRNPSNFNMLNRLSPELPAQDDPDGGYGHIIKNNLSYSPRTSGLDIINVNHDRCEIGMNSFLPTAMSLSDADFISLDENELTRPRQADGSLPVINFLRPKTTRLIGVGDVIGEDYTGTTLGCFQ
ncbi:MAG: right-handed parallel beta-helix repeat-containing protein [Rikenellaceae bacterium]|nr:right-handed parallel beta-helix repeat-containing protein [Rikenellaceae bacterium]